MAKTTGNSTLSYVQRCVRRNKEARKPLEWRWYENAAFAAGYSNINYDPRTSRPVVLGGSSDESSSPQVQDKLRKYHAKLVAPRMMPQCIPATNDRDARRRAEVANALILHFWEKSEFVYSDHAAKLNMMVFGNGIWSMQWNPRAGEWSTEFMYESGSPVMNTETMPSVDASGSPLLVDEPMRTVSKPSTSMWQSGLPQIRSVHPFNFFPDSQWRHLTVEQCLNYAERKFMPLEMVEFYFPDVDMDKLEAKEVSEDQFLFREVDDTFGFRNDQNSLGSQKMVEVWDFYHSPIKISGKGLDYPQGFRCIYIGDQVVDIVNGLPYNQYPHTTFRDRQYSDRGWGMCVTDVLRMAQRKLDLVERIQIRAAERTADPPILKPQGSNDESFQGRPGEIYEYTPYGEEKPSFMIPPQMSQDFSYMRANAMADLEALSLTSAPVGGQSPARGDSGAYLDRLLQENQVAMSPTVQEIETSQAHQANTLIKLCQDYLPVGYKFAALGVDKIPHVEEFDGEDFNLLDIRIVPGSASATYPGQLRTSIMQLAANGILQDESPRSAIITELMLGAPMAAKLTDLDEPGDRAVAELNIKKVLEGGIPYFKPWMNHERHIATLLAFMRSPKFFLETTFDQQQKLEALLAQHQSAIAPQQEVGQQGPQQPGAPQAAPSGAAQVPAAASGFVGELGRGKNPLELLKG